MAGSDIVIEQDSLEYTPSDGLRTRTPISLEVGSHNRVVIRRPLRLHAATVYGAFRHDSAFPNAGVVALLLGLSLGAFVDRLRDKKTKQVVQVYGHAESSGDEAHNKGLSERRARAFAAMLTASCQDLEAVAAEESWELEHHQFMLRVLRCDPGPIDGLDGDLTAQACEWFQMEYRDGLFHRNGRAPRQPDLPVSSKLDGPTKKALLEAFCEAVSPGTTEADMHPINPIVGCSEYNLANTEDAVAHRRVTLLIHDSVLPFAENAPCTPGDHSTCSLDKRGPQRCLWYRDHVLEPAPATVSHLHFDLRWLPLKNGNVLLTALTTLPEGQAVSFQLFRTSPILDSAEICDDVLAEELSPPLEGEVVLGVAQVVWAPPEGFDIRDFASWQAPNQGRTAREAWNAPAGATVPVFRISGGGSSALSPPPGADLERLVCTQEPDAEGESPTGLLAWDAFGNHYFVPLENGRPPANIHALSSELPRVVAFGYAGADADEETDRRGIL